MQKYNCKHCGAELYWDPDSNSLKCEYCEHEYLPSDFEDSTLEKDAEKKDESVDKEYSNSQEAAEDMVVYKCSNCGAEVVTSKSTMATTCAYCGRALSITNKTAGDFRPEVVVPFAISKDKAKEIYKKYLAFSPLTPKKFKDEQVIEKMQGIYIPFWMHSMNVYGTTKIKSTSTVSNKKGQDRLNTHTEYAITIDALASFQDVPADALKKMDNNMMDSLEPFDYAKLQEFNPAFMAGFFAEQPDEKKEDTVERIQKRVLEAMTENAKKEVSNYGNQIVTYSKYDHKDSVIRYGMLPVWILNVDWNDEKYLFAINGNTGKIVGKLPVDNMVLAIKSAAILLGVPTVMGFISAIAAMF